MLLKANIIDLILGINKTSAHKTFKSVIGLRNKAMPNAQKKMSARQRSVYP